MMTFRAAAADDIAAILAISNHYAATSPANFATEPETLDSWLQMWRATHEMYPWLIALDAGASAAAPPQGAVLGFAKAGPWKARSAYRWTAETSIYLRPESRGYGLGRALYARLIDLLRAQGYGMLIGGITLPNEASVGLHEAMGYRKAAHFPQNGFKFSQWHDVGYWTLALLPRHAEPGPIRSVAEVLARFE
jgi:phosphinothricin acetyltransferase